MAQGKKKMEEKNTNSRTQEDVTHVYITLDSEDLERMKLAKEARRKQPARSKLSGSSQRGTSEALDYVINCQFLASMRGVLLCLEMFLSLVVVIIVSTLGLTPLGSHLNEGEAVAIILNSITVLADVVHLLFMVTGVIEHLPSQAIVVSVQVLKYIALLLMQLASFLVFFFCGYGSRAVHEMLTIFACFVMMLGMYLTIREYKPFVGDEQTLYKRRKSKRASYKRLRRY